MDAGRPKRKRSELELLLGNGDANGLSAFSPRLPTLSASSPVLADAIAESDEQLARRLHEELNGMRMTRRGSKAVAEDPVSLSPPARGIASPHSQKSKAETPKAHGGQGRSSLPLLPPIAESAPSTVDAGASAAEGRALETCTGVAGVLGGHGGGSGTGPAATGSGTGAGTDTGSGTGSGSASAPGPPPEGSGEAVKRKRNSVPARELHLLLQQASSAAGRAEATLSPTRSARVGSLASARTDPSAMSNDSHHQSALHQQGSLSLSRRDLDNGTGQQGGQQHQHQPAGSTASAPVAMPPSPNVAPPPSPRALPPPSPRAPLPPPPPSLLPPKLKQRYLSGSSTINRLPASASASEDNSGRAEGNTRTGSGGATTATATTATTAATPNGVIGGARNSLLSSQSVERSSVPSQSQSQSHGRDGSSAGAAYTLSEAGASAAASTASLVIAGPRALAATGASIGGCSSTDETENDNDNSCPAAVAGVGDGGPSATSPKAAPALQLPPPLPPTGPGGSSQKPHNTQAAAQTAEPGLADHEPNGGPQWQAGTAAQPPPNQAKQGQAQGHSATGPLKVPKLPMIRAGRGWYRGRLMRESVDGQRVLVDVPGAPNPGSSSSSSGHPQNQPFWLPVTSDRIWRGSYKGKDWKYLGDGAWEPKPAAFKRGKQGSSSNGLPLPLPQWAVDIASGGADVEAQALPVNAAACATGVSATATGHRSKVDRGCWSSPDETSDDGEAAEELQQVAPEGPSTRSGQRPRRRSSPTGASFGLGKAPPAATAAQVTAVAAGDLTRKELASAGLDCPADATTGPEVAAAAPRAEAEQLVNAGAAGQDEVARIAVDADAPVVTAPGAVSGPGCVAETGKEEQAVPEADDAVVRMASPEGASVSIDRGPTAAVPAAATSPCKLVLIAQRDEVVGDGGEGCAALPVVAEEEEGEDKGEIGWTPGVTHPRKRVPRRAQRRQQRIRTPFDGLQLYLSHHQPQHNPYAFYPVLSDESGRDGDASDAEHGVGRRGSGDGTGTAPHLGGRRRAAARAAAVAAAAARAEAEAEEEELEEILLGRRPPRRDRFHPQYGGVGPGGGVSGRRNHHHQYHHRSRSGARVDSYLYGDSSGNPDDPYTVDGTVYVHGSSARPRASSRGNSQPAPEYMSVAGGAWEPVPWQAAGVNQMGDGGTEQAPSAPSAPPRNRRKGKPSRSRMDGEGDGWCCGEDDWELEARGGAWARMPEVLRRLYYTPCPAVAVATADGGDTGNSGDAGSNVQRQQQQGRQQQELVEAGLALTYRQSGGGAYFGALQFFNKRRRAYEDDPTVSLDDLDLDLEVEVDDHEHDADYLPPYGTAGGSRRSSGFGGGGGSSGRRCSANGGSGGAVKRQRVSDTLYLNHHNHQSGMYQQCQQGHDSQAAMVALTQPKRRILVTCGLPPGRSSGTLGAGGVMAGAAPAGGAGDGGIPAGLAGLLEAALGQDTASAAAVVHVTNGHDPTRWISDVKVELESTGLDTAPAVEAVVDRRGAETDAAGAMGVLPPLQGGPMPALAPGDPHGAHVALSDSSAAPSGLEDSKYCVVVGGGGSAVTTAIDASVPVTCADGSTGSAALLLQQQRGGGGGNNSSGGGAGSVAGGSSSPPPGVQFGQLRSNTPTRAKRTGRPPFAGLGAGAPVPKLPALSSTAAHRMQMVVTAETTGLVTIAAPVAIPADDPAANSSGDDAAAAAAAVVMEDPSHQPSTEALEANAQGSGEAQVPTRLVVHETIERPMGPNCVLPVVSELAEEEYKAGGGLSGGCKLWQTAGVRNGGDGAATKATQAGAEVAGSVEGEEATCQRGGPVLISNTVIGTGSMPAAKPYSGGEVTGYCVMDAIGALKFDKQPAMQQLAVRAQLEVEMRAAQHHPHGVTARQQDEQLLQLPQHHAQQQQRLLQGRGSSGRNGGSEIVRSGSLSAAASPPAPDPLISSLPSVEVVVNLFSARTPYGSAQQALTELVGASTALPLFQ